MMATKRKKPPEKPLFTFDHREGYKVSAEQYRRLKRGDMSFLPDWMSDPSLLPKRPPNGGGWCAPEVKRCADNRGEVSR